MPESLPSQLANLLERLGVASAQELHNVEHTAERMAGDLPLFQSVWIDALRQARLLTQFQAAEIMADRGERLRLERYILCHIVQECGYVTVYKAEEAESHRPFRLAVASPGAAIAGKLLDELQKLIALVARLPDAPGLITVAGQDGPRLWAASTWVDGTSAAEWMLHHGRFPPEVVIEVARQMLVPLAAMERIGLVHGDVRTENVILLPDGGVCLPHAGLRGVIRPHEGIAHCDLAPEACGALAPERVSTGAPPTAASDLFSCGCVWWQMLCGRPPLGGGDTMSRLCLAQTAAIDDFRHWATDVPSPLADAVRACLRKDPRERPRSIAALAEQMGPPNRSGRQAIVRCLAAAARPHAPWLQARRNKVKKTYPHAWTVAAMLLMVAVAVAWPIWVAANRPRAVGRTSASVRPQSDAPGGPPYDSSARGRQQYTKTTAKRSSSAVIQASYDESENSPRSSGEPLPAAGMVLRLPSDRTTPADTLQLKPGQVVCARNGRARIAVAPHGMTVQANRLTFENIDFLSSKAALAEGDRDLEASVLIRLACSECTFIGCSFQSPLGDPDLSTAIRWEYGASDTGAAALLSARVRLKDCVFRRVAAAVDLRCRGAIALECVNLLHLGPGPMLTLSHVPTVDEPLRITLSQVTLRDARSLVHFRSADESNEVSVGEMCIDAKGCAFAPRDNGALLRVASRRLPQSLLRELKWTGQGSVVSPQVVFAGWQRDRNVVEALDDAAISISGLVRGRIDFAGACDGNPMNSRVIQCQAPVEDSESTGANAASLPADVDQSMPPSR